MMREYQTHTAEGGDHHGDPRLETPCGLGYRSGMSSTGLIARKLSAVYALHEETPRAMGMLLRTLDGKGPAKG